MNKTPELVDLGLPSGNLWMTHNLGANSETDYGNYYQWRRLVVSLGKEANKYSYLETNNGKNEFDEEYFKANRYKWVYKNGLLRPEYDIVTQIYGPSYKIPEPKDFKELIDNTTSEYIENYKNSEKGGRLFTSKINGKTLFFPFSGYIWLGYFFGIGIRCNLWSGRLYSSDSGCAYNFDCNSTSELQYDDNFINSCGLTIRGIKVRGN